MLTGRLFTFARRWFAVRPRVRAEDIDLRTADQVSLMYRTRATDTGQLTAKEFFGPAKKFAVFGICGVGTPVCQEQAKGFLKHVGELEKRGIDTIVCIAADKPFDVADFAAGFGSQEIIFMSDHMGGLLKTIGLDGMMTRAQRNKGILQPRYSMLVDDGRVRVLNVDEPERCETTSAATLLRQIDELYGTAAAPTAAQGRHFDSAGDAMKHQPHPQPFERHPRHYDPRKGAREQYGAEFEQPPTYPH